MEQLYTKLIEQGYSKEQVENIFLAIYDFLEENYPILATLSEKELLQYVGHAA